MSRSRSYRVVYEKGKSKLYFSNFDGRKLSGSSAVSTLSTGDNIRGWDFDSNNSLSYRVVAFIPFGSKFTFTSDFRPDEKRRLIELHEQAFDKMYICEFLDYKQTIKLRRAYGKNILHKKDESDPSVLGWAYIGGNMLAVNYSQLLRRGDDETARTLIHEMMHVAGYTHPVRSPSDFPEDGGVYFSSPPLQSEKCIAGTQTDKDDCENGLCTIRAN